MSNRTRHLICIAITTTCIITASGSRASAQQVHRTEYPTVVNVVTPTVVGYTVEPAGLLGLRTKARPVVAPVATPVAVRPVEVVRTVEVVSPVTVVHQPAPVVSYAAPQVVPTYYAPAPVVTPVSYVGY